MAVGWVISMFGTTIEMTPADVGVRLSFFGRRSASRDAIRAMHWFSASFTFVDSGKGLLLRVASYDWTGSQVLELSESLEVPLYNHRTKRGWGRTSGKTSLCSVRAKEK